MKRNQFCTLFDSNYLLKGVAMMTSLARHCPDLQVHVLCMDQLTERLLQRLELPYVQCVRLPDVEDEELLAAKKDRSNAEYCWTLSSCFTWYVIQSDPEIDFITYLDADLYFYSSVQPLFDEIGDNSIAIIEHRFTPRLQEQLVNGRFCVEWVSFRRDQEGMACLSRWRDQCVEWCYYRCEEGRMGDQKYLDEWPERYRGVRILQHEGAGIAPWNYAQYRFGVDTDGGIRVQGSALVFYHFHQFQLLDNGNFERLSAFYSDECQEPQLIYQTYEAALRDVLDKVRGFAPGFSAGLRPASKARLHQLAERYTPLTMKNLWRRFVRKRSVDWVPANKR